MVLCIHNKPFCYNNNIVWIVVELDWNDAQHILNSIFYWSLQEKALLYLSLWVRRLSKSQRTTKQ